MGTGTTIFVIVLVLIAILSVLFVFKHKLTLIYVGLTKNLHTRHFLRRYVDKKDFLYLHDLCLRIAPGQYIKVDHVIIGDRFIYVIASKFYYGYLTGKDVDSNWVVSDGEKTTIIANPILDNEQKIDYVSRILQINPNILVNIVLVSKATHLDDIEIRNQSYHVLEEKDILSFIERYENDTSYPVFEGTDLERTASDLYEYHKKSLEDRRLNGGKKWNH